MGQTTVFTVSLDADDVAIDQFQEDPPRHHIRDAAIAALRDPRWRLAFVAVVIAPALVAGVTYAITGGEWVTTAFLVAAALVTPASGAWAGAKLAQGERSARAATWAVTGIAGALLALASLPGVALAGGTEHWGEAGAVPTLSVLACTGAAGAWLGCALANLRRAWSPIAAALATVFLTLAPIGVCAALLPSTTATDQVVSYNFAMVSNDGMPVFVCGQEKVEATRRHTEAVAWIAFASPIAWAVDAADLPAANLAHAADGSLAQAQAWVRSSRLGPDAFEGHCYQPTSLATPVAVTEARYEKAAALGTTVALASAMLFGAFALVAVSRRKSA